MDEVKNNTNISPRFRSDLEEIRLVATGGMAEIFRARQPALERFVVIKKLKPELAGNDGTRKRFQREAKALASVLHQNIAHVYDFIQTDKDSYILMEYIDGVDLSVVIKKLGHLPETIATCILLLVAKGVSFMHSNNLIHRDIKPSNIRLTSKGSVKLMDFGIVMEVDKESLTLPGTMVGSPQYLSPEQVLGDTISTQADQFLLGICLYEMLTGAKPFKEEQGETVFQRIRDVKYIPVRQMNPSISKKIAEIVDKCLQKNPEERYKNIQELTHELEKLLGSSKTAHAEHLILKYLDEEALLTPSMSYSDVPSAKKNTAKIKMAMISVLCLTLFGLGYYLGHRKLPTLENVKYPPQKALK